MLDGGLASLSQMNQMLHLPLSRRVQRCQL